MAADTANDIVDQMLARVHQRIDGGVDIQTFGDGTIEVRWRRAYGEELSDERYISANSLRAAFEEVLSYEDRADIEDERDNG